MKIANILNSGKQETFLKEVTLASTSQAVEALLKRLPIVDEHAYQFSEKDPAAGWMEGFLHWVPIGFRRGNAGQISLAKKPIAPLAERLVPDSVTARPRPDQRDAGLSGRRSC